MDNVTGLITKCGAYPLKGGAKTFTYEGKTITNTHRLAIELDDGNWYSMGETDKESFITKGTDGKWKILGAGSQVLIMYTLSPCGKYRNSKKSQLTVLNLVEGERFEKKDGAGTATTTTGGTSGGVNPAEVGQCINLTGLDLEALYRLSGCDVNLHVMRYKAVKEMFTKSFNGVSITTPHNEPNTPPQSAHVASPGPIGNQPSPSPMPDQLMDADFDDDIPF